MNTATSKREALRGWLVEKNGRIGAEQLSDDCPLLEQRVIGSLQIMDLLLFIEELRGRPVTVDELTPAAFASIDAICRRFFEE